jgi:hypothetical protein
MTFMDDLNHQYQAFPNLPHTYMMDYDIVSSTIVTLTDEEVLGEGSLYLDEDHVLGMLMTYTMKVD